MQASDTKMSARQNLPHDSKFQRELFGKKTWVENQIYQIISHIFPINFSKYIYPALKILDGINFLSHPVKLSSANYQLDLIESCPDDWIIKNYSLMSIRTEPPLFCQNIENKTSK